MLRSLQNQAQNELLTGVISAGMAVTRNVRNKLLCFAPFLSTESIFADKSDPFPISAVLCTADSICYVLLSNFCVRRGTKPPP